MKFRVLWSPQAERELAQLWLQAEDRSVVTQAAQTFEKALEIEPETSGESRSDGLRVMFAPPLGINFGVLPRMHEVVVISVWRFRSRKPPKS